jgi:selenocysteine insertion sequence-binding protein 2
VFRGSFWDLLKKSSVRLQVAKSARTKRAKCIIVAPNIEETTEEGALDTSLASILEGARQNAIETVCALTRLRIAQVSFGFA